MNSLRRHIMMQVGGGVPTAIMGDGVAYLDFSFLNGYNYESRKIVAFIDLQNARKQTFNDYYAIIASQASHSYKAFYSDNGGGIGCSLKGEANSHVNALRGIFRTNNSTTAGRIELLNEDWSVNTFGSGVFNARNSTYANVRGIYLRGAIVYWLKVFNADFSALLYDFVPYTENGEVGLYDVLNDVFRGNVAEDGSFTAIYE